MRKLIFLLAIAAFSLGTSATADARDRHYRYDRDRAHYRHDHDRAYRHHHHGRTRSIYVIENHRPVRRVVYIDNGRYYRLVGSRRVYITGRYFTSYPSRYYYSDGRPRVGVSVRF